MRENCDTGPSEIASPLCAPPQRHSPALFLATLFLITRKWHRPRCVPTEEGVKELWPIYTTGLSQLLGKMKLWSLKGACAFSIPRQLPSAFSFQCKCRRSPHSAMAQNHLHGRTVALKTGHCIPHSSACSSVTRTSFTKDCVLFLCHPWALPAISADAENKSLIQN